MAGLGVLGLLLGLAIAVSEHMRRPTPPLEPPCRDFVQFLSDEVRRALDRSEDREAFARTLCALAGAGPTGATLGEADRARLEALSLPGLRGPRPRTVRVRFTTEDRSFALQAERDPQDAIWGPSLTTWFLPTSEGRRALIDTGVDVSVLPVPRLPAGTRETRQWTFFDGVLVLEGQRISHLTEDERARLEGVFASEEASMGLLGTDVLLAIRRPCLDFEARRIRSGCPREDGATVPYVPLDDGRLLVPLRIRPLRFTTWALLDTGTAITDIHWHACPEPNGQRGVANDLGLTEEPLLQPSSFFGTPMDAGPAETLRRNVYVWCTRAPYARPYTILGMSYLNQFAAIEIDQTSRTVTFFGR
jgi:hypothetical protein